MALAGVCVALLSCVHESTGLDTGSDLVETHRAILSGSVEGSVGQPLENVEVIVDFGDGSQLPRPTTRTDGAGEFLFVLAMYNGDTTAVDSAAATVYAIARTRAIVDAVAHQEVVIHFVPVHQEPSTTTVRFALPVP